MIREYPKKKPKEHASARSAAKMLQDSSEEPAPADEVSSDDTESSKSSLTKSGTSVERMGQRTLTRGTWDREGNVLWLEVHDGLNHLALKWKGGLDLAGP